MKRFLFTLLLFIAGNIFPQSVTAQSQSLSVTPPLFQLSIEPGDIWQSSVRVINTNEFPLTVFAEVVNFVSEGENGLGKFMPLLNSQDSKSTLAEWIEIHDGPHVIPKGESKEISFFIEIPEDAAPGGHFAAILISTEPPSDTDTPLALVTTQTVATLFFMRIEGDVIEKADIREFTVLDRSIELPEAEFSLRFENKGNVHLQPKGDIIIANMWGKERGIIPINQDTHFGNVLPASIRDFKFTWKGERSLTDIGRYKAIATLAYGEDGSKSVSQITYFWVIPVKGVLITVGSVLIFIYAVTWMIRRYIRRMLLLSGVDPDHIEERNERISTKDKRDIKLTSYKTVSAPLRSGALDLRTRLSTVTEFVDFLGTISSFVKQYFRFFIALLLLILAFFALVFYIAEVGSSDKTFEVTIDEGDSTRIITDDEVRSTRTD